MFPGERRKEIVKLIEEQGSVTVEELAKRFCVSVDSIRKDLKVLSDAGKCRREYGGALRNEVVAEQTSPAEPQQGTEEYDDIGRHAVATRAYVEINDGDSVFLDASRTNLFLADLIAKGDKRCIVTTNMIGVLERLSSNPRITALGTGGYLNMELNGFTGSATVSLLEPLLFAKAFIGCCGIDLKSSAVMSFGMDDGIVRQRAVQNASYKFLLANSMKFGIRGGYRFASITDFSAVITNTTDPAIISQISRMRTPVLS